MGDAYYVTVPGAGDKIIHSTIFTDHWLMPDTLLATRLINIRKTIPSLIGHIGRKAAANISIFIEMAWVSEPMAGQVFVKRDSESNCISAVVG